MRGGELETGVSNAVPDLQTKLENVLHPLHGSMGGPFCPTLSAPIN